MLIASGAKRTPRSKSEPLKSTGVKVKGKHSERLRKGH